MNNNKLHGAVIPNGVNISNGLFDKGVQQEVPEYILFCGSLWSPPNSEGLFWFYTNVWPLVKNSLTQLKLLIVGSGELPYSHDAILTDASVEFAGTVTDVKPFYNKAAIAIVPLLSGSGTRLKILEAMSLGLPVVSTSKGAEGIDYINQVNIIIADEERDFADALINLLNSKTDRLSIQESARKLVREKYDWDIIGSWLLTFLNNHN